MCELWRSLVDGGGVEIWGGCVRLTRPLEELAPPESVREVVARRLARLRPATADLLELAATAGSEFDLEVLRPVADADLLPALEEAVSSGMIEEIPSRGLAYRFTHELVRRSLYDGLSAVRRAELHLRVGEALERSGARSVADLAHHFAAAAPFGGVERAVEYNVRAARAASEGLDFDGAAEQLGVALELGVDAAGGARQAAARARSRPPPRRPRARGAVGVRRGGRDRRRPRRRRAARAGGDRLRGGVLAAGDRRPALRRAARAGGRRARRRAVAASRRRARGPRTLARDPRPARARRPGSRRRGGDGAAARRPPRARPRAGGELLGPWDALATRRSSRCSPRRATSPSRSATTSCGPRR